MKPSGVTELRDKFHERVIFYTDYGQAGAELKMLKRAHLTVSSHLEELSTVQQWFRR